MQNFYTIHKLLQYFKQQICEANSLIYVSNTVVRTGDFASDCTVGSPPPHSEGRQLCSFKVAIM